MCIGLLRRVSIVQEMWNFLAPLMDVTWHLFSYYRDVFLRTETSSPFTRLLLSKKSNTACWIRTHHFRDYEASWLNTSTLQTRLIMWKDKTARTTMVVWLLLQGRQDGTSVLVLVPAGPGVRPGPEWRGEEGEGSSGRGSRGTSGGRDRRQRPPCGRDQAAPPRRTEQVRPTRLQYFLALSTVPSKSLKTEATNWSNILAKPVACLDPYVHKLDTPSYPVNTLIEQSISN